MIRSLEKQTILIVDDSTENIVKLDQVLGHEYITKFAINGQKALTIAKKFIPDLILLDTMMQGMDGFEVCVLLKEDPRTKDIPIIFSVTQEQEHYEDEGIRLGAVEFITKPINPVIVKNRIKTQLALQNHKRELVLQVHERTKELSHTQDAIIHSLVSLVETRSYETGSHIMRIQEYVSLLAKKLSMKSKYSEELDSYTIALLYKAASLHDIGKVGIKDEILLKPGSLTKEEFETMKTHTKMGRDILQKSEKKLGSNSFLTMTIDIAYYHHEKWDGSGYPEGIKGIKIPLSARIMAIADVYDAIVSKKVYKKQFSHLEAVEIISGGSGTFFCPDVVSAFVELQNEFHSIAYEHADTHEERMFLKKHDSQNRL
ncbi:MAG: response regulator [Clostridiales bacterium]|nr:response regulator [Clostridiales bacterium]